MTKITLEWPEVFQGAMSGVMRRVSSKKQKLDCDRATKGKSGWESDICGALGEMAFAKYANLFCSHSVNSFKRPDVGTVQVRATGCPDGHLIVTPSDSDTDPYVLLIGKYEHWEIVGWITGRQAKHPEFWRKDNNSWWVPISELEDISTLPQEAK